MEYVSLSHSSTDVAVLLSRMNQVQVGAFRVALIQRLSGKTALLDKCFEGDLQSDPLGIYVFVPTMEEAVKRCVAAGDGAEREDIALHYCNEIEAPQRGDRKANKQEEALNRFFVNEAVVSLDKWFLVRGSKFNTPCEIDVFAEPPLLRIAFIEFFHCIDKQGTGLVYFKEMLVQFMDAAMKVQKSLTNDAANTVEGYSMVIDKTKGCFARMRDVIHVPSLKAYIVLADIGISRTKEPGEGPVQTQSDQTLRIIDEHSFSARKSMPLVDGAGQVYSMCFITDYMQGYICMSYSDGRVRFVDAYSNQVKMVYPGYRCRQKTKHACGHACAYVKREDPNAAVTSMQWLSANKRLYVGTRQGEFMVWDLKNLERVLIPSALPFEPLVVYKSRPHTAAITGICCLSQGGDQIATGSLDCTIGITNLEQKFKCRTLQGHQAGVRALAYNPYASYLVSASEEEHEPLCWAVNVINVKPLPMRDGRSPHTQEIVSVVSVPHSSWTISMDVRGMVKVWDLLSISCVQTLQLDLAASVGGGWRACAYNETKRQFLTAAHRKLYVLEYNVKVKNNDPLAACTYDIIATHYLPEQRVLISVSSKNARLWDTETGQQVDMPNGFAPLPHINDQICSSCVSADNAFLYLGTASGMVLCILISTGERVRQWLHPSGFRVTLLQCIGDSSDVDSPLLDHNKDVSMAHGCGAAGGGRGAGGTVLVALAEDGSIQVVTDNGVSLDGKALSKKIRERVDVQVMAYDAPHEWLLLGSSANVITVFDVRTWTVRGVCSNRPLGQAVTDIAPCNPHEMFVSGDAMGGIHLWGVPTNGAPILLKRFVSDHPKGLVYTPGVVKLAWSAALSQLFVANDNLIIHCYEVNLLTQARLGDFLGSINGTFMTAAPLADPSALPISELTEIKYEMVRSWHSGFAKRVQSLCVLDSECRRRQYVMGAGGCSVVIWDAKGNQISQLARERVMAWNVGLTATEKPQIDCKDVALAETDDECSDDRERTADPERESRESNPPTPHTLVENLTALLDEETHVQMSLNALEAEEAKKRFQRELKHEIDKLHGQLQKMCPGGRWLTRKPPTVPLDCSPYDHHDLLSDYKLRETIEAARNAVGGRPLSMLYRVAHGLPMDHEDTPSTGVAPAPGGFSTVLPPLYSGSHGGVSGSGFDMTTPPSAKAWTLHSLHSAMEPVGGSDADADAAVASIFDSATGGEGWQSVVAGERVAEKKRRPKRKAVIVEDENGNITVDVRPKTNTPPRTPVDQVHPSYMTAKRADSVQVSGLAYDKEVRSGAKSPVDVVYGSGPEFIKFLKRAAIACPLPAMREKPRPKEDAEDHRHRKHKPQPQRQRQGGGGGKRRLSKRASTDAGGGDAGGASATGGGATDDPPRRAAGVKPTTGSALYHLPPVHYRKLFEARQQTPNDSMLMMTSSIQAHPVSASAAYAAQAEMAAAVSSLVPQHIRGADVSNVVYSTMHSTQQRPTKLAPMQSNDGRRPDKRCAGRAGLAPRGVNPAAYRGTPGTRQLVTAPQVG